MMAGKWSCLKLAVGQMNQVVTDLYVCVSAE